MHSVTRGQIVEAGLRLAMTGKVASLRAVAAAVPVVPSTVSYHFRTKQAMTAAIEERAQKMVLEPTEPGAITSLAGIAWAVQELNLVHLLGNPGRSRLSWARSVGDAGLDVRCVDDLLSTLGLLERANPGERLSFVDIEALAAVVELRFDSVLTATATADRIESLPDPVDFVGQNATDTLIVATIFACLRDGSDPTAREIFRRSLLSTTQVYKSGPLGDSYDRFDRWFIESFFLDGDRSPVTIASHLLGVADAHPQFFEWRTAGGSQRMVDVHGRVSRALHAALVAGASGHGSVAAGGLDASQLSAIVVGPAFHRFVQRSEASEDWSACFVYLVDAVAALIGKDIVVAHLDVARSDSPEPR